MATHNRRIDGAIIQDKRLYKAGDEDAFATAMRGKSVAHLIANKTISGDWSEVESAEPVDDDTDTDPAVTKTENEEAEDTDITPAAFPLLDAPEDDATPQPAEPAAAAADPAPSQRAAPRNQRQRRT